MRKTFFLIASGLNLCFCSAAMANEPLGIGELEFGASRAQTLAVLESVCSQVDVVTAEPVQFPLSSQSEEHIRCHGLATKSGTIERSIFLIADDSLSIVELQGGAVNAFDTPRDDEAREYLHYKVFDNGRLFSDRASDTVWLLREDALHPNLFTWSNPYLDPDLETMPVYEQSAQLPAFMTFGVTLNDVLSAFEANCPILNVETNTRVWLPNGPSRQTQVNCFGLEYAGFPRKFEAVFGDDRLELLWILTAKPEEHRVRKALVSSFGQPDKINTKWEIFKSGQIALRKDKPEVLAISRDLTPYYFKDLQSE